MVGHLDADCFYVSAERVRHAELIGKPVGVLGNNGACVIAKSYEMKAQGVNTGTPIWDAKVLCPDGVYVKRDFYWYEALSRKRLDIVGTVQFHALNFLKRSQDLRDLMRRKHQSFPNPNETSSCLRSPRPVTFTSPMPGANQKIAFWSPTYVTSMRTAENLPARTVTSSGP